MAANTLALLLALVVPQLPPGNVVVVTADPAEPAVVEALRRMPLEDAVDRLRKDGFLTFMRGPRTYAIDPGIAQDELHRNLPEFYRALSNRQGRTLSTNESPVLARFAEAAWGSRFDRFDQSTFVVGGAASIELKADGRSIRVSRESLLGPELREAIESKPMIAREAPQWDASSPKLGEFLARPHDSLHMFVLGKSENRRFSWASDFEEVARMLDERLQAVQGVVQKAIDDLYSRLPSDDLASQAQRLDKGQDFSSVSGGLRQSLEVEITGQYARFGFADEAEAERFLARATVGGVNRGLKVTGARKKGALVSVILFP